MASDGNGHALDIRTLPIASLRPADYNPRMITEAARAGLAASIDRWGCVEPIIWNQRSGNVVGGHQRLDALIARGDAETDVVVVDLDAAEEKALNIALNNQAIAGEWDWGKLAPLLPEIEMEIPDLDMSLLGFEALGDDLLANLPDAPKEGLTDPDDVPEPQGEAVTRPGDLWTLGEHRLMCGDCTDAGVVERVMGGGSTSTVITDPPYGMGFQSNHRNIKHPKIQGDDQDALLLFACGIEAEHSRYVFCRWDNVVSCPKPASLVTWAKNNWSMGDLEHAHARQTECVLFYPGTQHAWPGQRPTDLVAADRTSNKLHPTEKPVSLLAEIVAWTLGTVYDPFSGSGTTLIACEQLSRRCRAVEIEPRYCDVALRRWAAFTGRDPVREDGVTFSSLLGEA